MKSVGKGGRAGSKRKPATVAVSSSSRGVRGIRLKKGAEAGSKSNKKREFVAAGSSSSAAAAVAAAVEAEVTSTAARRTITRAARKKLEGCEEGDQNCPAKAAFK